MAPYEVTKWGMAAEPAIHVALGMGFGFVLERAGFGSAKKLTNQFYLNDMTVLKVMFTAIITAMVLILAATTFGLLEFDKLWINPTYLGSGILGGFVFGIGFVVGGYCPGTALVSTATLKLDGLLFTLGVLGGIFAFGYTEPLVDGFWNDSGNFGQLTLFGLLGQPMPIVVLLVLALALLFFAGAEWIERLVNRKTAQAGSAADSSKDAMRPKVRPAYVYAAALVGTAAVMALVWAPTHSRRVGESQARAEAAIRSRQIFVDPRELADLMRDKRLALALLDTRDESRFNRFHLLDARLVDANLGNVLAIPARTVKVLVDDSESAAVEVYRRLAASKVENLYILAGGLSAWNELFDVRGCDQRRFAALGAGHPRSRPPEDLSSGATAYVAHVKRPGLGAKKRGGGCGG